MEKETKMLGKKERKREKERWGFNGRLSIISNLAQEEAIFLELDGWINAASQTFITARRHQLLLCSSPGRE